MLTSLIFAEKTTIGELVLDAVVSEAHEIDAEVTRHPVEEGSPITDHVTVNPARLTIEGVISETPLRYGALAASAASMVTAAIGAGAGTALTASVARIGGGSLAGLLNSFEGRSKRAAFAELERTIKAAGPLSIVTGLTSYDNMVMTSLSIPRDAATGEALRFSASFTQVRTVSSEVGTIAMAAAAIDKAAGTAEQGKQATSGAPASVQGEGGSHLYEGSRGRGAFAPVVQPVAGFFGFGS